MKRNAYAFKLDPHLLKELRSFCERMGYKQGSFVEKALREKMDQEELKEDIFDLVTLRSQEKLARPLSEFHRSRK